MLKRYQRKTGGNWYLRGTVAGHSIHESTGTSERRIAEAIRIRREAELLERRAYGPKATVTFAEAALTYLESGGEGRFLTQILRHFGPDTLLAQIDNATVNRAALAIYPDARGATINRQLITPISAIINMAAKNDLCSPRHFKRRADDRKRLRWLTPEEAERLIAAAPPHLLAPLGLLLGGGCRTGEALALDVSTFYPNTGEAYLPDTKNGHPRMIRLPTRALDMVLSQDIPDVGPICRTPKGMPYVIRENGGGQIAGAFRKACEAADLGPEVTPHVLRHTWATWFYAQTRDFGGLLDLGGWQKADMANRYRKIPPSDLAGRLFAHGWDFTIGGIGPEKATNIRQFRI